MNNQVTPIQRNLRFKLPVDRVRSWHKKAGMHGSQFMNTMSLFFPEGERFFIQSVRNFRNEITDLQLQKAVKAFIGQEAMHGREHEEYNKAMVESGFAVDRMEAQVTRLLNTIKRTSSNEFQLAVTIALEHLTAILADVLLKNPDFFEGSDPNFTALWQWHALEETEHKAVAFDVFQEVMNKSLGAYLLRTSALVLATGLFFSLVYFYYFNLLKTDGEHTNVRGIWRSFQFQWLKPGLLRLAIPAWLDYFKPGFHPWQHDNREFLTLIDELEARVASF